MTPFQEKYGFNFRVTYRNVHENVVRMLQKFDRLVDCEEVLTAVYSYFGASNLTHDAAIQGWIDYYSNTQK